MSPDSDRIAVASGHWVKKAIAVLAFGGLLALLWVIWAREFVTGWMQEAAPLPFFSAMTLLPAIGIPLTPFFVVAGATFGVQVGLIGSFIALGANLAFCYWIARSGLRPRLEALLRRSRYELPDFREKDKGALRFTLLVKVTPGVPAFIKHYVLGFAGVPFGVYFAVSMIITGVYGASFVVLGESLFDHDVDTAVIAAVVVVVIALALWWWRRRRT